MEATVSEIHAYPMRPRDFFEPLFWSMETKREVMEHFLEASWIKRASVTRSSGDGGTAHVFADSRREAVELRRRPEGKLELLRGCSGPGSGPGRQTKRRRSRKLVVGLVERWREVRNWWEGAGITDVYVYRFVLVDGSVVDVARDPHVKGVGEWTLVGIVD